MAPQQATSANLVWWACLTGMRWLIKQSGPMLQRALKVITKHWNCTWKQTASQCSSGSNAATWIILWAPKIACATAPCTSILHVVPVVSKANQCQCTFRKSLRQEGEISNKRSIKYRLGPFSCYGGRGFLVNKYDASRTLNIHGQFLRIHLTLISCVPNVKVPLGIGKSLLKVRTWLAATKLWFKMCVYHSTFLLYVHGLKFHLRKLLKLASIQITYF